MATLLPPGAIAALLIARTAEVRAGEVGLTGGLESVRLVDTYWHSIWGPRVRLRDVEDAVRKIQSLGESEREEALERVRRVVKCEKKTERIQGGDNGDERGVLD